MIHSYGRSHGPTVFGRRVSACTIDTWKHPRPTHSATLRQFWSNSTQSVSPRLDLTATFDGAITWSECGIRNIEAESRAKLALARPANRRCVRGHKRT